MKIAKIAVEQKDLNCLEEHIVLSRYVGDFIYTFFFDGSAVKENTRTKEILEHLQSEIS